VFGTCTGGGRWAQPDGPDCPLFRTVRTRDVFDTAGRCADGFAPGSSVRRTSPGIRAFFIYAFLSARGRTYGTIRTTPLRSTCPTSSSRPDAEIPSVTRRSSSVEWSGSSPVADKGSQRTLTTGSRVARQPNQRGCRRVSWEARNAGGNACSTGLSAQVSVARGAGRAPWRSG
jgi:hypothetical protein